MEPTLKEGDYLIILKSQFFTPSKRDVVVFSSPYDQTKLVKRIKGIAGEKMNKFELFGPMKDDSLSNIPKEYFFAQGDNSKVSFDSRFFGVINNKDIIGKAVFIYWSKDSTGINFKRAFSIVH